MSLRRPETLDDGGRARTSGMRSSTASSRPGPRLPEVALAAQLETSRGHRPRGAPHARRRRPRSRSSRAAASFVSQLSVRATWEITSMRALLEPYASRLALEARGSDPAIQREVAGGVRGPQGRGRSTGDPRRRRGRGRRVPSRRLRPMRPRDAPQPARDARRPCRDGSCSPTRSRPPTHRRSSRSTPRSPRRSSCGTPSCSRRRCGPTSSRPASCS